MKPENKRLRRIRKDDSPFGKVHGGGVPYSFGFGSMSGEGLTPEERRKGMKQYMPHTWSRSAKFMKVCELLDGAPRWLFSDSACVSNLAQNKAGMIEYRKRTKKYHLTRRGRYYLKTREVKVNLADWFAMDSIIRFGETDAGDIVRLAGMARQKDLKGAYEIVKRAVKKRKIVKLRNEIGRLEYMLAKGREWADDKKRLEVKKAELKKLEG